MGFPLGYELVGLGAVGLHEELKAKAPEQGQREIQFALGFLFGVAPGGEILPPYLIESTVVFRPRLLHAASQVRIRAGRDHVVQGDGEGLH